MRLLPKLRLWWWLARGYLYGARWRWRNRASDLLSWPVGQHQQQTEAEKWKAEHGFSPAGETAPWDDDLRAHNAKVNEAYRVELERRQFEYRILGTYTPRYGRIVPSRMGPPIMVGDREVDWGLLGGVSFEVSWEMEMSLRPGARADVTGLGKVQPDLPADGFEQQRRIGNLHRMVNAAERAQQTDQSS